MARPWPLPPLRVFEPRRILAGEAVDEDVVPAVGVEVMAPAEEVVGVPARVERLRGVDLVTLGEGGAGKPPRPRGDVGDAILVEVAHPGPLGDELAVELLARMGDQRQRGLVRSAERGDRGEQHPREQDGSDGTRDGDAGHGWEPRGLVGPRHVMKRPVGRFNGRNAVAA